MGSGGLNATPREARTYAADFTKNLGAHNLSMGFQGIVFMLNTFNSAQATFNFSPDFTQGPLPTAANTEYCRPRMSAIMASSCCSDPLSN